MTRDGGSSRGRRDRRGRPARARAACSASPSPRLRATDRLLFLYATTAEDNRVVRADARRRRRPRRADVDPDRHPEGRHPRRRPAGVRARRLPLRLHRRDRRPRARPGPRLAGRQDPADHHRRRARRRATPTPTRRSGRWGHRNVQGLAFDDDGQLWASEFGDQTFDELNLIEPRRQLRLAGGRGPRRRRRTTSTRWSSGRPRTPRRPAWPSPTGTLWMAALRGERLWRVAARRGDAAGKPAGFFAGEYGRIRTVVTTPDGDLWVDHLQPRRPRHARRRGRPDPARHTRAV